VYRATTIPADHTSSILIDAPWPKPLEEYEQVETSANIRIVFADTRDRAG
jgi:hypothetical protein